MLLYFSPGACSLSPHIVLREAGLPFETEQVDLAAKTTKSGADFRQINPRGAVPVLKLDNGEFLTEGPAIVQYLADRKPDSGLAPAAGTMDRYRLQEWLNIITSELHKGFSPLFNPATPEESKTMARAALAAQFDFVEKHLAGKTYLMNNRFTVADAYLFTVVNWVNFVAIDLAPWPNLTAFMARVAARPKVQEAMKAEGLIP